MNLLYYIFSIQLNWRVKIIIALFVLTVATSKAQSFEEILEKKQNEYTQYVHKTTDEYYRFVEEHDKEFREFLAQQWQSFEQHQHRMQPSSPKPVTSPHFADSIDINERIIDFNEKPGYRIPEQPQINHFPQKESFSMYRKISTSFIFYQQAIEIEHADVSQVSIVKQFNNYYLSQAWEQLRKSYIDRCITQLLDQKKQLRLNDWGYYLLVKKFSQQITNDIQQYKLFLWYLLVKSKYDVKIGYTQNELLLLVPFNTSIYEIPYYTIGGKIYYVFEADTPGTIKTYTQQHKLAEHIVEPQLNEAPAFRTPTYSKSIPYQYRGQQQPFAVMIKPGLKQFYNQYPLMELDNYFNAVMSNETASPLIKTIKHKTINMNEAEAVEYILHFVQNAFEYKPDHEQFGKEKVYFPDEIFYYPYSDCDDRAVFFAYLVKKALNLKVVGLDYPGHVAVAVNFNEKVPGNYVLWQGNKYVICDPTYNNAPVGVVIPEHMNTKADIIKIQN